MHRHVTSKMNTKTMRLPPRRLLTSNKRKEFESFDLLRPHPQPNPAPPSNKPLVGPPQPKKLKPNPAPSNQILAGYLAHEYLTKGTLFGQPWDPTRPESADPNSKRVESGEDSRRRYVEVCDLLKGESGPHLPGVYNPGQLARFLQM